MNKRLAWTRTIIAGLIITLDTVVLTYYKDQIKIPTQTLAIITILGATIIVKLLEDFLPKISNFELIKRSLAPEEFVQGWWVGQANGVSVNSKIKHYQVEEVLQDEDGNVIINGWNYDIEKHVKFASYNSSFGTIIGSHRKSLIFPYQWANVGSNEIQSNGLCTRDLIYGHSRKVPCEQSGHFS